MGNWIEAWLLKRQQPLRDIGELYQERRKASAMRCNLWLLRQALNLAVNAPDVLRAWREVGPDGLKSLTAGGRGMDGWIQDVRIAVRGLGRRKGWTLAVLLTLGLGTGAATALFSVAYSVLARPLPYPDPDRLVRVYPADPARGVTEASFSMPDWRDWASSSRQLESLALYSTLPSDLVLTGFGEARELETAYVTSGFFETLGVPAALGRTLRADEEQGDNHVVVLSHGVWERAFGADPRVVGTTVMLKAEAYRIVGVMPAGFGFPTADVELYTFLTVIPTTSTPLHLRVVRFLNGVGRLAPGASLEGARSELSAIAEGLAATHPDTNASLTGATVQGLRETLVTGIRPALLALMVGALLFLLGACVNVAGLLLVRQSARASEFALRTSLGAGRRDLSRHVVVESALLAAVGSALGLGLASVLIRFVVARSGEALPRVSEITADGPVFLFAAGVAVAVTGLIALIPARSASRIGSLALGLRRERMPSQDRARGVLVAAQVGLAAVILIVAGLMVRSLNEMARVDPGFEPENRLVATVNISSTLYPERTDYMAFYRAYLSELGGLPGVQAVGAIRYFPTRGVGESYDWARPGLEAPSGAQQSAYLLQIDAGLPTALGMSLVSGRHLSDQDSEGPPEILINRALARAAFGGEEPVGQQLVIDGDFQTEIVGVVEDVKQEGLGLPTNPTLYVGQASQPRRSMSFVIHTAGDPLSLTTAVRDRLRGLDEDQPLAELTTAEQVLSGSLSRSRFLAVISGVFGVFAGLLAIVGAAGAVAHAASRRSREIGIRIALGERPGSVSVGVLRRGFKPILLGLMGGLAVALGVGGFLRGILFGVAPHDWVAVLGALGGLGFFSLMACLVPALRAAAVDPATAMRLE